MWHRPDFYIPLIYLLGAIPYAALGLYAWHKRPAVAVTPFAWTMLGCSIWSFGYGLEVFFPSLLMKLLAVNIEYVGIIIIPVFLLFFAIEFTGKSHLLSPRTRYLIWVIPVATLILVWINPWLRLMWSMETVEEAGGLFLLDVQRGFFFWLHIFYSYALVLVAVIMLVMDLLQRPGFYRIQTGLVILGVLFPLIGNIIFVSDSGPLKNLDLTPLFFIPTALGLSWAVFKYRLLEILPPEHFTVLKNMKNGVIILNPHSRILYINPVMEGLMDRREDEVIGQPLAHAAEPLFEKLVPCLVGGKQNMEISFDDNGQPAIYDVTVSHVHHQDRRVESAPNRVIVFHDITARKEVEADLSRREAVMSAINFAAEHFLKESRWEHHIPAVLEKLGQAANVSRVFVSVNYVDDKNITYSSLCYEWVALGVSPNIRNPAFQHVSFRAAGFGRWENTLSQNLPIHGLVRDLPETERKFLQALGNVSFAAIPIFVESQWWGFIMFDECQSERVWSNTELKAFHAAANIFGAAETRARTEQKLFRRQSALKLLHKIVETALQAETIEEMGQVVVDRLGELIHADGCFLTLWDDIGRHPTVRIRTHTAR
ncbi:MAG TPA: histidine kinase N-terminal 7TM domain-containing protein [Anaerolineales bacterium]|nr:histidine kinase N-terminal 7TM domain-containing protein [Anaerolineales bacterium]